MQSDIFFPSAPRAHFCTPHVIISDKIRLQTHKWLDPDLSFSDFFFPSCSPVLLSPRSSPWPVQHIALTPISPSLSPLNAARCCSSSLALPSQTLADWPPCVCLFLDNSFLMLVMVCGGSANQLLMGDLSCSLWPMEASFTYRPPSLMKAYRSRTRV